MSARTGRSPIRRSTSAISWPWSIRSNAGLDVRLDDPLVGRGVLDEVDNLGDRVLGPPSGPVAVGRRVEVDLKDRLQDELEGHLDDPILERWNTQVAELAAPLWDRSLADGHRPEATVSQLAAQFPKEPLHAEPALDVVANDAVDPSCA
jgi:hypothetical protein